MSISTQSTESSAIDLLAIQQALTEAAAAAGDQESLFAAFVDGICELPGIDCAGIYLLHPASGSLHLRAHRGISEAYAKAADVVPSDSQRRRQASPRPLWSHTRELPDEPPGIHALGGMLAIGLLPIMDRKRLIGTLVVASRALDTFPPIVRSVVAVLVAQLSSCITRLHAEDSLRRERRLLEERVSLRTRQLSNLNERLRETLVEHRATTSRLEAVLNSAQLMIWVIDTDGIITHHRGRALPRLGLTDDQLVGKSIFELAGRQSPVASLVRRSLSGESVTEHLEVAGLRLMVHLHPWRHENPRDGSGAIAVAIDATALHQAEAGRAEAERKLNQQRAQAMRTDRLRALGQMAAGIAHELNQPLTGIRGKAEHLLISRERRWPVTPERLSGELTQIVAQVDRMEHVINHVRMFARQANDETRVACDLNQVTDSALLMLRTQIQDEGITIECDLAEDLPAVWANPYSLEEVVLNLLQNARDACFAVPAPPGGAHRITLRTATAEDAGTIAATLHVRDSGSGISSEVLPHIFDPFYTTKGPDEGSGLGLAISRSIVESLGGSLSVASRARGGTTLLVALPAHYPHHHNKAQHA